MGTADPDDDMDLAPERLLEKLLAVSPADGDYSDEGDAAMRRSTSANSRA